MFQSNPSWFFKFAIKEIIRLQNENETLKISNKKLFNDEEKSENIDLSQHIIMCEMVDIFDEFCEVEVEKVDDDRFEVRNCFWENPDVKNKYNELQNILFKQLKEKHNAINKTNGRTN